MLTCMYETQKHVEDIGNILFDMVPFFSIDYLPWTEILLPVQGLGTGNVQLRCHIVIIGCFILYGEGEIHTEQADELVPYPYL